MRHTHIPAVQPCAGPLFWFEAGPASRCERCGNEHSADAVLECCCGYMVTTGNFHDDAHTDTPIMRKGLAHG